VGEHTGRRSRRGLLVALGVDNLGSGLFLPLALVYTTAVVGVPLAPAGALVTAGTLVGLAAPPLAGAVVDRHGPKRVVVASAVLQALGMAAYLLATGPATVLLAAALVAAGGQTFYASVFALVADVAPDGPKDHAFATVEVVRSAAFGAGALVAAAVVTAAEPGVLRGAVVVNGVSFVVAGALLVALVHPRRHTAAGPGGGGAAGPPRAAAPVWRDRPYLALVGVTVLLALPTDLLLVGGALYLREVAPGAAWAAGASIAVLTALIALLNRRVVRWTARWRRTTAMGAGGACLAVWAASLALVGLLPTAWVGPWVLASSLVLAAGSLLFGTRVNALAEAAAPPATRGRHLAAFQYAFTAAALGAPLLVAVSAVSPWLPWAVAAVMAAAGGVGVLALARHLPPSAVRP